MESNFPLRKKYCIKPWGWRRRKGGGGGGGRGGRGGGGVRRGEERRAKKRRGGGRGMKVLKLQYVLKVLDRTHNV